MLASPGCRTLAGGLGGPDALRQRQLAWWSSSCGSQQGLERESVELLGGGVRRGSRDSAGSRCARAGRPAGLEAQPDLGQRDMLERMFARFRRAPGAADETDSFVVAAQALLAAQRSTPGATRGPDGHPFPVTPH